MATRRELLGSDGRRLLPHPRRTRSLLRRLPPRAAQPPAAGEADGTPVRGGLQRRAYSYAGVDGSGAHRELAKPLAGTLFFAGEATSDQTGTVAGAIESGRRAARRILRPLP
ncbi:MAG: FAD-dependent oxidoreductase [Acidobacteriota bacterium]